MESPKRGCDLGPCVPKTLAFKKPLRSFFCYLKTSLGARACVYCVHKAVGSLPKIPARKGFKVQSWVLV